MDWRCWVYLSSESESVSHLVVSDFATPWIVACQTPLYMEFSRLQYGVGSHSLLQRIFPTQGSNLGLPYCRQILYRLSHQECALNYSTG